MLALSRSLLLLSVFAAANGAAETEAPTAPLFSGGNFNVSRKDFQKVLNENPLLLVGFSASSCRHCLVFEPEYINATKEIAEFKVPFARMDLDKSKEIAEKYKISSLPSIKFFRKGKVSSYEGVHGAKAIRMYVEKQVLPAVRKIGSKERLEAMKTAADVVVLGFFGNLDDEEDEYNEFVEAATEMRGRHNVYFGEVSKGPIVGLAKSWRWFDRTPSVVLFQNFDINNEGEVTIEPDRHTVLLTELSDIRLVDWISKNSVQIVAEMTPANFQYYEDLRLPMLMLFINKSDTASLKSNAATLGEFKAAAVGFRGKISFVFSDVQQMRDQRSSLGLLPNVVPAIAFNTLDTNLYPFPHSRSLSAQNIKNFARDYLMGELKPKSRSAASVGPRQGHVVEVIGSNFADIVMDEKRDVMLLVYIASDPATETIMLYYKKVAEKFVEKNLTTIVIARIDIEENQLPVEVSIHKLPAVLFFPANDKSPPFRMYHGKGKVRPLMLWAGECASKPLGFTNDTPDLNDEQRVAYLEQLAELNERKEKEQQEKDKVQKLKEEWKAEADRAQETEKREGEKRKGEKERGYVWRSGEEEEEEEEIFPVQVAKKREETYERAKEIPWASDVKEEAVPVPIRKDDL